MITLDIVTPTKKLAESVQTASVKLPTPKGEIQVLDNHRELITLVSTGIITAETDGVRRQFFVSQGFCEVKKNKIVVLAETSEESNQIDKERAKRAQKKAEEALKATLSEENFKKYQLKLQRAVLRQEIAA